MKTLLNFLTEARQSNAVVKARRMGLKTDGHGGWYNAQGEFVAKTEKGELKFYNKGQKAGEKDTPKTARPEGPVQQMAKDREDDKLAGAPKQQAPTGATGTKENPLTVAFGRFNPPTTGHQKLFSAAKNIASGGELRIYPSRTVDPKKNPLDPATKIKYMKQMFPDYEEQIVDNEDMRSIFNVLTAADEDGFKEITIVVGSDRLGEFKSLANKYNGQLYNFDQINVLSAGERDSDSDNVEGMSASKLRKAAAEDDYEAFKRGIPKTLGEKEKKNLYNALQKSMKTDSKDKEQKESVDMWEIAPIFDPKTLREKYVKKQIFNIGDLVESLHTGLIGRVMRRGANHLICLTKEGLMFKSWVKDIKEYTEVKMNRMMRTKTNPNTLVGTKGYLKYAEKMTPGSSYGRQFINKYKKKKS